MNQLRAIGPALVLALAAGIWAAPVAGAQVTPCPNAELRAGISAGLPDCRALELVSPANKVGGQGVGIWYAGIASSGSAGVAAYGGERFAVQAVNGGVLVDGAYSFANDYALAERTDAGWVSNPAATRGGYGAQQYRYINLFAASEDLSLTAWDSNGGLLRLFPELESWEEAAAGVPMFMRDWKTGRWDLFGVTDVSQNESTQNALTRVAVSLDGSHAIASGRVRGLGGGGDPTHRSWPSGFVAGSGNAYLFDLSEGLTDAFPAPGDRRRILLNSCTAGTAIPERSGAGKLVARPCPTALPGRDAALIDPRGALLPWGNTAQAISTDASRVFFMSPSPDPFTGGPAQCSGEAETTSCPAQVYVRQRNTDGSVVTRWVSRSRSSPVGNGAYDGDLIAGQDASLMAPVFFEGASRDGSRVFFRTTTPLTPDDPNGGCGGSPPPCTTGSPSSASSDLYMYELPAGPDGDPATPDADPGNGRLTRISAGPTGAGDCGSPFPSGTFGQYEVVSAARFVSDDGERVYFVCDVPIAGVSGSGNGTITAPGSTATHTTANFYLYDATRPHADRWRFVAQLPRALAGSSTAPPQQTLNACATTAFPLQTVLSGGADSMPTLATAGANCVRGVSDGSFVTFMTGGQLTADDLEVNTADLYTYDATADTLTRATQPAPGAPGGPYTCAARPGLTTDLLCNGDGGFKDASGRGSGIPLPPLGLVSDPAVEGDRIVFFQSRSRLVPEDLDDSYDVYQWKNGDLSLLSTWESGPDGALYAGNSRDGRNVYITTRDQLTWQDSDAVLDVYTMRVEGGIPEPDSRPACDTLADSCQGAGGGPPAADAPASTGPGEPDAGRRGARARVFLRGPTARQRAVAARTGVLRMRVRVSAPSKVTAVAKALLGSKAKLVGRTSKRVPKAGATLRLRLDRTVRRRLAAGKRLRLAIRVRSAGALARTASITLRRAGR